MLTLHVAGGQAVLVQDDRIAALGPAADLAAAHPGARVREWAGADRIAAGAVEPAAGELLEHRYHPDPREGVGTGARPLPAGLTPAGLGGSARRGVQALLSRGVTAVVGPFERPEVRTAVARSGLAVVAGAGERSLTPGGRADFAVLGADPVRCLATVLAGRIVYRARD
ncbi:imidazolonepropionase-like domain-containing protein [Kitasatospora viridis]|uniref:Aminodeoxyfutalosine deaminase/Imidazolonepropionase-like composite domain-containing protein n=1 Tax=Kitasatospora viridis TaxID=281105 RepID=A0A561UG89_9ACTN|nr:hypothetical protein [Kitasatospora viridis]TWF98374.1 hypothetical protein FHX73_112182 [Kitasatospora viridis]